MFETSCPQRFGGDVPVPPGARPPEMYYNMY